MSKKQRYLSAIKRLKTRSCTCPNYIVKQGIKQPYPCPHKPTTTIKEGDTE